MTNISSYFSVQVDGINEELDKYLAQYAGNSSELDKAMRYSSLLGGKRIRPILVLESARCFDVPSETAMPFACAIEFIHAYSLVHDDLPAMDDDELRRGQNTCHIEFDEATAILTGDALQTLAFQLVSTLENSSLNASTHLKIMATMAKAAGAQGMVAGQAIDLGFVGRRPDLDQLRKMHELKTGALIEASVKIGALCSTNVTESDLEKLSLYAKSIGLGFQVKDDILDVVSDTETLGKQQGADQALDKPTYPSIIGLEQSKAKLEQLHQVALDALSQLPHLNTTPLEHIANFIVHRAS